MDSGDGSIVVREANVDRLILSGLATIDQLREANKLREIVLAKIARARYVRDITAEAKHYVEIGLKIKAIKGAIHVGK